MKRKANWITLAINDGWKVCAETKTGRIDLVGATYLRGVCYGFVQDAGSQRLDAIDVGECRVFRTISEYFNDKAIQPKEAKQETQAPQNAQAVANAQSVPSPASSAVSGFFANLGAR